MTQLKDATLLLVDDEPYYIEIAKEWFEREGCRVLSAQNGLEAIPLIENNKVDAIITDIRMPGMDGVELVKKLKTKGNYTPTAVALTGFSDLSVRDAYDLGIESQLSKPVSRKVLLAAVQKALTDREQLWSLPLHPAKRQKLAAEFESIDSAVQANLIAFGRGGFCLCSETIFPDDSGVEFKLVFTSDQQEVTGQGIVRWTADLEQFVGVEIERVHEASRDWLLRQTRANPTLSFIPRSPDGERN